MILVFGGRRGEQSARSERFIIQTVDRTLINCAGDESVVEKENVLIGHTLEMFNYISALRFFQYFLYSENTITT